MLKRILILTLCWMTPITFVMAGHQFNTSGAIQGNTSQPRFNSPTSGNIRNASKLKNLNLRKNNRLTIEGDLQLRNAPLAEFYFKLNGRKIPAAYVHFTPLGSEFSNHYRFKISMTARDGSYTLEPAFNPGYRVRGQWNPRNSIFRISALSGRNIRNKSYRWIEATGHQSIATRDVLTQIRGVMRSMKIHLNNYGPKHPDSRHNRSWQNNNSYIRFQGNDYSIGLWEVGKKINRHHYYYYVNDFNLSNVDVSMERNLIRLAFNFETQGAEIKGHCLIKRAKILGGWSACPIGSDKGAPDINLTHPTFVVYVQPSAFSGSVSFGGIDVRYTGGVRVNGVGRILSPLLTTMMRKAVKQGLTALLSRSSLRQDIARAIRSQLLDPFRIGYVTSVRVNGNRLEITYRN